MEINIEAITVEISKLDMQPNEYLVIKLTEQIPTNILREMAKQFRDILPGIRKVILPHFVEFQKISEENLTDKYEKI